MYIPQGVYIYIKKNNEEMYHNVTLNKEQLLPPTPSSVQGDENSCLPNRWKGFLLWCLSSSLGLGSAINNGERKRIPTLKTCHPLP